MNREEKRRYYEKSNGEGVQNSKNEPSINRGLLKRRDVENSLITLTTPARSLPLVAHFLASSANREELIRRRIATITANTKFYNEKIRNRYKDI